MRSRLSRALLLGILAAPGCQDSQAPLAPAAGLIVTPAPAGLVLGDTLRLQATVLDAQGDTLKGRIVAWASSDPGVATVSPSGLITAVAGGTATISAATEAIAGSVPVTIVAPLTATEVYSGSASFGSCAKLAGGSVRCWGQNTGAAIGIGVTGGFFLIPVLQQGGPVQSDALGEAHGCSLAPNGDVRCWGQNLWGEVGDSSLLTRVQPVAVKSGGGFTAIGAGRSISCGLRPNEWLCWGNIVPSSRAPAPIAAGSYHGLAVGESHSCALMDDGTAWCVGSDFNGQLGDDGAGYQVVPVAVAGGQHFTSLSLGGRHSCGIDSIGGSWCWGNNSQGALGDGSTTDRGHPVAVSAAPVFTSLAAGDTHTCGLTSAGVAWCWGDNSSGQLGDGTTTQRPQPVSVGGALRFSQLAAGAAHTCGVALDGRVYCWGNNDVGSLGDGTTILRLTPTLVHAS